MIMASEEDFYFINRTNEEEKALLYQHIEGNFWKNLKFAQHNNSSQFACQEQFAIPDQYLPRLWFGEHKCQVDIPLESCKYVQRGNICGLNS